ncbi:uncharacterized protein I303_106556 [Kwoniella dejecticola CBS 10117]|uniref:Pre-mRNA-splicing factor 18 n=1 Tax=Kwoniella dejecticola CBS 10117 TaxID=1296121 RepID=A0A1A5ZUD3_9TREE|nr:pre-mRNA-splicing factor 18 [Kwoniella dejecticola CBS 10117]OBR81417.1 pre-mRNA-splicing factor 18 [Kwoniella dejecticola CBS 10117]
MDGLLAEISAKRKALEVESGDGAGPANKYMRRADVERLKEEELKRKRQEERAKRDQERQEKMKKEADQARHASLKRLAGSSAPSSSRNTPEPSGSGSGTGEKEGFNISPEECIRRLRAKGQPIRLFGESDKERRLRLRALELIDGQAGGGHHGRNDFMKALEEMESSVDKKEIERKARELHKQSEEKSKSKLIQEIENEKDNSNNNNGTTANANSEKDDQFEPKDNGTKKRGQDLGILDLGLVKSDPNKLYPLIYYALKNVVKEWEEYMDLRPEEIRRSTQGRMAAATQVQSAQNLKPLFKSLRSRDLPPDVLRLLAELVHHMQSRSYLKANDAYLRLSIGNAAWPIGVTSVGIHERSAREKIGQDNIAHVLNDEVSRKYIQAVKRLLTFSQTIRPPADVSQLMG